MTCFACEREPARQCPRCGRPFCEEHGEDVCDACLHPASGVPSFTLYRGSLLALLIGTAVAVWLIVQPGGSESSSQALRPPVISPTAVARSGAGAPQTLVPVPGTPQTTTGTPGATGTQSPANTIPGPAGTPGAPPPGATPAAGATPPPAANTGSYTVVSGDSLSSICSQVKPASMSVTECVDRVVSLNRLADSASISVGQTLTVPR